MHRFAKFAVPNTKTAEFPDINVKNKKDYAYQIEKKLWPLTS